MSSNLYIYSTGTALFARVGCKFYMNRCSLCPGTNTCIPPSGPFRKGEPLYIGEAPGWEENRKGQVFVGKTGRELREGYLPVSGQKPEEVTICNAICCLRGDSRVVLSDGTTESIRNLCANGYRGMVRAYDEDGNIVDSTVTDTFSNPRYGRSFIRFRFNNYRAKGYGEGRGGPVLTKEHLVLTKRGWIEAGSLTNSDLVCTGTIGLTDKQRLLLNGTMMGDSHIARGSLILSHCQEQIEWLELKRRMFGSLNMSETKRILFGKYVKYTSFSPSLPVLREMTRPILLQRMIGLDFDVSSVAALFMDDGSGHRNSYRNTGRNYLKQLEIACCPTLSDEQIRLLSVLVSSALKLDSYSRSGRILLTADSSRKAAAMLAPYIPPSMRYKLIGAADSIDFDLGLYDGGLEVFWDGIQIEHAQPRKNMDSTVYCLETEHHNFLTRGGGIVHNCMPDRPKGKIQLDKEKDRLLLESCASAHLYEWIDQLQPSLLVPMGAFACYAIDPGIDLEIHHGMPIQTKYGIAFPMYHPARGIHEPKKMIQIRTDWIRLRRYLRGTLVVPQDEYPNPDYSEVVDKKELNLIDPTLPMACDTEASRRQGPYCITYSQIPGTGRLIRAERADLLHYLQQKLNKWESNIIFHNWMYDWNITEQMGLEFPFECIQDTMIMAYHLANLPQGLKVLAYRLLGMEMQSFEDLVKPYSTLKVLWYYKKAQEQQWPKPEEQLIKDDKTGKWKLYRPQSLKTKLKRFFTDYGNNEQKDVFKMWETWESYQEEMEQVCGPYPGMDIRHVPDGEALTYACRDSDATLRLYPVLQQMKENAMSGKLQEQWELVSL